VYSTINGTTSRAAAAAAAAASIYEYDSIQ
jgi:hypothetical protein